jgi:hypothetical protein
MQFNKYMAVKITPTFWKTEEQLLFDYVKLRSTELATDVSTRKGGLFAKNGNYKYAGYDNLRDFFDGDQWPFIPEEGGHMRVYNFCAATVMNYTSFMTNESPEFDIPVEEITDEVEVERAERKEVVLKEILKDNVFTLQFEAGVQIGSLLGDTFVVGPFWDSINKRIYFSTVKRPEMIKPIFSADDFQTIIGYIHEYFMAKEKVEELFEEQLAKRNIKLTEEPIVAAGSASSEQHSQKMVKVQQYWDDKYMLLTVNDKILDFTKHDWGFVPLVYIQNIMHPLRWNGISDIENMLDAQQEYNEKNANISDIISGEAYPTIFGKNLQPISVKSGKMALIDLGDDAELIPDPRQGKTQPIEQVLQDRQKDIYNLSGLNEIIFGGAAVTEASGRALSVIMQAVNNRIKGRQIRWRRALQTLSANIFILLEKYVAGGKDLIGEIYDVDVFFPGTLLRNITDEINKQTRNLQSRYTTMKNMGVPSPKDEEELMKKEKLSDAQLQIMIQQMVMAAMPQQTAGGQPAGEGGGPMLQEFENEQEQPAAVKGVKGQQSPVSAKGNLAQQMQRQTGVPAVKQTQKKTPNK